MVVAATPVKDFPLSSCFDFRTAGSVGATVERVNETHIARDPADPQAIEHICSLSCLCD